MVYPLVLYMLLASVFTIGKSALSSFKPIFFIAIRMTLAGSILLGYLFFFKRSQFRYEKKDFFLFLQIVVFHIYFSYITEFLALLHVSSIKACFLYNLAPFVSAFFSFIYFGECLNKRKVLGLILGIVGFIPFLISSVDGKELFFISYPEMLLFFSVVSACYGWIIVKQLVVERSYSPLMINGIGMFFGGIAAMGTSFSLEDTPLIMITSPLKMVFYVLSSILIANIICYNLYGALLKTYSATFLSLVGLSTPLFASLYGWYFLCESISSWFLLSNSIVFLGLYLFYQEEKKQRNIL